MPLESRHENQRNSARHFNFNKVRFAITVHNKNFSLRN